MTDNATMSTRRAMLAAGGAAVLGATAGCAGLRHRLDGADPATERSYRRLPAMAVHVADGVDRPVPAKLSTVDASADADLVLLPDDTDVAADRAVGWLGDDRDIALLGDDAEATWLAWARSDAYADAFGPEGVADGDPDPQLVVASASGDRVTTHRKTWGGPPDDEGVFLAIDGALVDLSRSN